MTEAFRLILLAVGGLAVVCGLGLVLLAATAVSERHRVRGWLRVQDGAIGVAVCGAGLWVMHWSASAVL